MSQEFEKLVAQAVHVQRELRTLEGSRASAKCWMAHCLGLGDSQNFEAIRDRYLERRHVLPKIRVVIEDLVRYFAGGHMSWPSDKIENMARLVRVAGGEEAAGELAEIGLSRWELFALAVEVAAKRYPNVFGDVDDMGAREGRLMELDLKRTVLLGKLNTGWQPDDVHIHEIRADGAALITFKLAMPDLVPVAPQRDCGERLVNTLASREDNWA